MNKMKQYAVTVALLGATSLGLAACGGETPTATPLVPTATTVPPTATTAPSPTATPMPTNTVGSAGTGSTSAGATGPGADLLNQAQIAMKGIKSYHFVLKTGTGGTTTIQAEGDFMAPDSARLSMDLGAAGKTEMIIIGQDSYVKDPTGTGYISTGSTGSAGLGQSLSPSQFGSFAQGAQSVTIVGDETIDGASTTHVKFSYNLDQMASQSATATGLATPGVQLGMTTGDAWIEKGTNYLRQMQFVSPAAVVPGTTTTPVAGTDTTTTITYSKFNEAINPPIQKPTNITTVPGVSDAQTALPSLTQMATNLPSSSDLATAVPGASDLMTAIPGGAPATSGTPTP